MTAEEVALILGATSRTAARWCAQGLFPGARKIGAGSGMWMIPREAVQTFERPRKGPKGPRTKRTG